MENINTPEIQINSTNNIDYIIASLSDAYIYYRDNKNLDGWSMKDTYTISNSMGAHQVAHNKLLKPHTLDYDDILQALERTQHIDMKEVYLDYIRSKNALSITTQENITVLQNTLDAGLWENLIIEEKSHEAPIIKSTEIESEISEVTITKTSLIQSLRNNIATTAQIQKNIDRISTEIMQLWITDENHPLLALLLDTDNIGLQQELGVKQDGIIWAITINALMRKIGSSFQLPIFWKVPKRNQNTKEKNDENINIEPLPSDEIEDDSTWIPEELLTRPISLGDNPHIEEDLITMIPEKKEAEKTDNWMINKVREAIYYPLGIEQNLAQNNTVQNFTKWAVDEMLALPEIIEFAIKNPWKFYDGITNIDWSSVPKEFMKSITGITSGEAYTAGRSAVFDILLLTGMGAILKKSWSLLMKWEMKTASKIGKNRMINATNNIDTAYNGMKAAWEINANGLAHKYSQMTPARSINEKIFIKEPLKNTQKGHIKEPLKDTQKELEDIVKKIRAKQEILNKNKTPHTIKEPEVNNKNLGKSDAEKSDPYIVDIRDIKPGVRKPFKFKRKWNTLQDMPYYEKRKYG